MVQLRDYQQESVEKILNMSEREKKIACLPTGSGKTILLSEICRRINSRILIVVQSSELRQQTLDKLKMVCGESVDVGSIQGNLKEYNHKIIVATRQTLTSGGKDVIKEKFKKMLEYGSFKYVIFDECHCATNQQKTIIENLNKDICVLGLTATPYNISLKNIYDGIIYKRELIDMMKEKYLVEPLCYQVYTDTDISNVKVVGSDFVEKQLSNAVNTDYRNNLIVKSYMEKCKSDNRNKTIVFCTTVNHSKKLAECFNKNGIKAISIDGSLNKKDREKILKDFHDEKYQVVCNVNVLSIGFDEPSIDSIIFARPTKSKMLYIQQLGRGLRLYEDKKDCLIIDVVDVTKGFNIVTSKTIFDVENGETPTKALKRKAEEKNQKNHMEELEKNINEQAEENLDNIKNTKQEKNINIDDIKIYYQKENILAERISKESNVGFTSLFRNNKTKYDNEKNNKKDCEEGKNKKSLIGGLFRKIFNLSL